MADPMTKIDEFDRDHDAACAEEGHLLHTDEAWGTYCLRCPYIESQSASQA